MITRILEKLRTINPWHFVWIIILVAEVFTFILNSLQSFIRWGYLSWELIEIGTIDALVVSILASPIVILSLKGANEKLKQDIAERKQMEDALKNSEEKYRLLIDNIPAVTWISDNSGQTAFISPNVEKIYGYTPEEINNSGSELWLDRIHPDEKKKVKGAFEKLFSGVAAFDIEYRVQRKDGHWIWIHDKAYATFSQDKKYFAYGTFTDITERKQMENQLGEYRDHLEELVEQRTKELSAVNEQLQQSQKMEAVGLLAGGIAHDFSNILTTIKGSVYLMQKNLDAGSPLIKYVEQVITSINKANDLSQSLLTFSRKQAIALRPMDFNGIIHKAAKMLSQVIGEDIELVMPLNGRTLTAMADMNQIEQVLLNLATNARDAMPGGGMLTIQTDSMEIDERFQKEHGFGALGKYVLLTVSDTGVGMEEEIKRKIYEPFFTTKELGKGSGLGLAVTYGIVKQHNGFIDVETAPGKGTTFRIYVPAVEAKAVQPESRQMPLAAGGRETILLAEDDADTRGTMSEVLQLSGYTVIEAGDGEEAARAFTENSSRIDLVFLDVRMPKKNGREVYEEIKKVSPETAVLFMSGYTKDIIDSQGIIEEKLNFISKAAMPEEILKKIREVLDSVISSRSAAGSG